MSTDTSAAAMTEMARQDAESRFVTAFDRVAMMAYENAAVHGFHAAQQTDVPEMTMFSDAVKLLLWITEIAETFEAIRKEGYEAQSEVILGFTKVEEEVADLVIRVMDTAYARKWALSRAIIAKMRHNETRPFMHGGKKV